MTHLRISHDTQQLRHKADIDRWFASHVARLEGAPGLERITWRRPDTSQYAMTFTLSSTNVFVAGDLYTSVYDLRHPATRAVLADMSFDYLTSKLRLSEQGETEYDEKTAVAHFDELVTDTNIPHTLVTDARALLADGPSGILLELELDQLVDAWLYEHSLAPNDVDWYHDYDAATTHALRAGEVPTIHTEAHWLGLQYALAALNQNNRRIDVDLA